MRKGVGILQSKKNKKGGGSVYLWSEREKQEEYGIFRRRVTTTGGGAALSSPEIVNLDSSSTPTDPPTGHDLSIPESNGHIHINTNKCMMKSTIRLHLVTE